MLRSVAKGENSASWKHPLSMGSQGRATTLIKDSVDKEGLSALIPKKTGPKESYKLKQEGQAFGDQYTRQPS